MKRKTKAQREAEQRAALFQRVRDIYSGAQGSLWDEELDCEQGEWLNMETAERTITALYWTFRGELNENGRYPRECIFERHMLSHYESATKATDLLFERGVRA